MGLTSALD